MPLRDSISFYNNVPLDSLSSDSLYYPTDTLIQYTENIPQYFNGISILSLPGNENWVFAFIVGLFFLLIFAAKMSSGLIIEEVSSVFKVKERSSIFSNLTAYNYRFRYLYVFFSLCVFALFAYSIYYNPVENDFSFLRYIYFLLAVVVWFIVKLLFIELLGYVFFDSKTIGIARRSYLSFISLLGIILFPLLIIYIYATPAISQTIIYISLGACGVISILIILKLFQIFFSKLLDFFYILLYLCTLEILPVLALFQVFDMIK